MISRTLKPSDEDESRLWASADLSESHIIKIRPLRLTRAHPWRAKSVGSSREDQCRIYNWKKIGTQIDLRRFRVLFDQLRWVVLDTFTTVSHTCPMHALPLMFIRMPASA